MSGVVHYDTFLQREKRTTHENAELATRSFCDIARRHAMGAQTTWTPENPSLTMIALYQYSLAPVQQSNLGVPAIWTEHAHHRHVMCHYFWMTFQYIHNWRTK